MQVDPSKRLGALKNGARSELQHLAIHSAALACNLLKEWYGRVIQRHHEPLFLQWNRLGTYGGQKVGVGTVYSVQWSEATVVGFVGLCSRRLCACWFVFVPAFWKGEQQAPSSDQVVRCILLACTRSYEMPWVPSDDPESNTNTKKRSSKESLSDSERGWDIQWFRQVCHRSPYCWFRVTSTFSLLGCSIIGKHCTLLVHVDFVAFMQLASFAGRERPISEVQS